MGTLLLLLIAQYGPNLNNNSIGPHDVSNSLAHGLAGEAISLLIQVHFEVLINFSKSGIFRPPSVLFWHALFFLVSHPTKTCKVFYSSPHKKCCLEVE